MILSMMRVICPNSFNAEFSGEQSGVPPQHIRDTADYTNRGFAVPRSLPRGLPLVLARRNITQNA